MQDFNCKERGLVATEKWHRKSCDSGSFRFKKMVGDADNIIESIFGSMKVFATPSLFRWKS